SDEPEDSSSDSPLPTDAALSDLSLLKRRSALQLHVLADELGLHGVVGLGKAELILKIEQTLLRRGDVLIGDGVLEILDEGYGFLRSQDWNYLYSPDDIYVSPSQIRRFSLRT